MLPRWAREYGSGNSGEGDERPSVGWQERVAEMAEKEAVERQLQARRAAAEARRDEKERLSGEMGGEGEVCGREVGGEVGEGSEDPERGKGVPVRGIEEDGEARGDESRPLPVWHPRKRARATRRAAAAQAAEAARKEAGPSRAAGGEGQGGGGRGGRGAGQGSSMDVGEEATVVMSRGKGKKRSLEGNRRQRESRQKRREEAVGAWAARQEWEG